MAGAALHHNIHEIGDDILRVVEFDRRQEVGVAGDVGNREICRFSFRKHRDLPRNRFTPSTWIRSLSYHTEGR